jgi:hypothetical protein
MLYPVMFNRTLLYTLLEEHQDKISDYLTKNPLRLVSPVIGKGERPVVQGKIIGIKFTGRWSHEKVLSVQADLGNLFNKLCIPESEIECKLNSIFKEVAPADLNFYRGAEFLGTLIKPSKKKTGKKSKEWFEDMISRAKGKNSYDIGFRYALIHEFKVMQEYSELQSTVNMAGNS